MSDSIEAARVALRQARAERVSINKKIRRLKSKRSKLDGRISALRDVLGPGRSPLDLTGEQFGALVAIERFRNLKAGHTWVCYCATCGALQDRLVTHLRGGHRSNCKHCRAEDAPRRKRDWADRPGSLAVLDFRATFDEVAS